MGLGAEQWPRHSFEDKITATSGSSTKASARTKRRRHRSIGKVIINDSTTDRTNYQQYHKLHQPWFATRLRCSLFDLPLASPTSPPPPNRRITDRHQHHTRPLPIPVGNIHGRDLKLCRVVMSKKEPKKSSKDWTNKRHSSFVVKIHIPKR